MRSRQTEKARGRQYVRLLVFLSIYRVFDRPIKISLSADIEDGFNIHILKLFVLFKCVLRCFQITILERMVLFEKYVNWLGKYFEI